MDVGDKYGRLTYEGPAPSRNGRPMGIFICSCGSTVVRNTENVRYGNTRSCGCLKREATTERNYRHGMSKSREYRVWTFMIQRCYNPKTRSFKYYGAIGVDVCAAWKNSFEAFFSDMGPAPEGTSLERVNGKLGYCKSNCIWADDITQANNKSSNIVVEYLGRKQTLKQWAREVGLQYSALYYRWQRGWEAEKMLTTPSVKFRKNEL